MVNAYTSKEHTSYYVKIASEHLDKALDYLSDNVLRSINLPEEFERERGVIIEDLKMHKDRPMEEVEELFEEKLFCEKSLARRIGGSPQSVKRITLSDLNNFEKQHYHAGNAVMAIVGNIGKFSENELLSRIEQYFSFQKGKDISIKQSSTTDKNIIVCDARKIEQTNLALGFGGPGLKDEDRYIVKVMTMILGGGMSSRMFTEVREKRGLAYAIHTSYQGYSDTGMILTQAGIANENLKETVNTVIEQYQKIIEEKVSSAELRRAKEMMHGSLKISLEDSENLADMLVSMELTQGRIIDMAEIIERIQEVTEDDVQKAARKYLSMNKMIVSVVGPRVNKDKITQILSKK